MSLSPRLSIFPSVSGPISMALEAAKKKKRKKRAKMGPSRSLAGPLSLRLAALSCEQLPSVPAATSPRSASMSSPHSSPCVSSWPELIRLVASPSYTDEELSFAIRELAHLHAHVSESSLPPATVSHSASSVSLTPSPVYSLPLSISLPSTPAPSPREPTKRSPRSPSYKSPRVCPSDLTHRSLDEGIRALSEPYLSLLNEVRDASGQSLLELAFVHRRLGKFSLLLSYGAHPLDSDRSLHVRILHQDPALPNDSSLRCYRLLFLHGLLLYYRRLKASHSPSLITDSFLPYYHHSTTEQKTQNIRTQISSQLTNISVLNLSNCALATVPPAVWFLVGLETLDLSDNQLSFVPDRIASLSSLQELDLSNNPNLQYLPASLAFLNEPHGNPLKRLRLGGCSLSHIPETIKFEYISNNSAAVTCQRVLPYLRFLREEAPFKTLKLMFLGQEGVGKTSLIRALTGSDFGTLGPSGDTVSTEGIDLCEWKIKGVSFSVWDFGGQAVFYPTHQFFITDRSVYVIAFDLSSELSQNRLDYWMKKVQAMTSEKAKTPILLVGTHADSEGLTPARIDATLRKISAKYPRSRYPVVEVLAVSTKRSHKRSVKLMKKALVRIGRDKQLRFTGTTGWKQVQQAVLRLKKTTPCMPTQEFYQQVCGPYGISSVNLRPTLRQLHDSGLVVYFDDVHMGADGLVILDPEWLSKVIASMVTFSNTYAEKGFLKRSHLRHVWMAYPRDIWPVLLRLLERFEVAHPWHTPDGESRLIVPSLLPKHPPAELDSCWPKHPPQGFREYGRCYQFQFVPMGFFSRLLMRLIRTPGIRIVKGNCWVSGAMLSLRKDVALIVADEVNYKVSITIREALKISCSEDLNIDPPSDQLHDSAAQFLLSDAESSEHSSESSEPDLFDARPSHKPPPNLMRTIVEILEPLLEYAYPSLASTTLRSVPCTHCLAKTDGSHDSPFMFSFDDCFSALSSDHQLLYCCGLLSRPIRVSNLAPDLTFSDLRIIEDSDYTIRSTLGVGGFGTVHLAAINSSGALVAVKELTLASSDLSPEDKAQKFTEFQREAHLMSSLDSPYLVKLYGITLRPQLRLVMEYIDGCDLYHLLHDPNFCDLHFPWSRRLSIALDIARGMSALHSCNPPIVHADLRSPNIFLAIERSPSERSIVGIRAKVADFGLSRRVFNYTQGMLSTWQWMPPEVLDSSGDCLPSGCCPTTSAL